MICCPSPARFAARFIFVLVSRRHTCLRPFCLPVLSSHCTLCYITFRLISLSPLPTPPHHFLLYPPTCVGGWCANALRNGTVTLSAVRGASAILASYPTRAFGVCIYVCVLLCVCVCVYVSHVIIYLYVSVSEPICVPRMHAYPHALSHTRTHTLGTPADTDMDATVASMHVYQICFCLSACCLRLCGSATESPSLLCLSSALLLHPSACPSYMWQW